MVYSPKEEARSFNREASSLPGEKLMKHREVIWFLSVFLGLLGLAAGLYFMARPPERRGSLKPALQEGVFVAMEGPTRITSSKTIRSPGPCRARD